MREQPAEMTEATMGRVSAAIEKLDATISDTVLLGINAAMFAFVALAHGGALLTNRLGIAPQLAPWIPVLYASLSVAITSILLSLIGMAVQRMRWLALAIQTSVLLFLGTAVTGFGVYIIACGIPPRTDFRWNIALFAFTVAYPIYVARRTLAPHGGASSGWVLAPIWAAGGSLVVSALIYWRIISAAVPG